MDKLTLSDCLINSHLAQNVVEPAAKELILTLEAFSNGDVPRPIEFLDLQDRLIPLLGSGQLSAKKRERILQATRTCCGILGMTYPDMTVRVAGQEYGVNSLLFANCPIFAAMMGLNKRGEPLEIEGISVETFRALMGYLCGQTLAYPEGMNMVAEFEHLIKLTEFANQCGWTELLSSCDQALAHFMTRWGGQAIQELTEGHEITTRFFTLPLPHAREAVTREFRKPVIFDPTIWTDTVIPNTFLDEIDKNSKDITDARCNASSNVFRGFLSAAANPVDGDSLFALTTELRDEYIAGSLSNVEAEWLWRIASKHKDLLAILNGNQIPCLVEDQSISVSRFLLLLRVPALRSFPNARLSDRPIVLQGCTLTGFSLFLKCLSDEQLPINLFENKQTELVTLLRELECDRLLGRVEDNLISRATQKTQLPRLALMAVTHGFPRLGRVCLLKLQEFYPNAIRINHFEMDKWQIQVKDTRQLDSHALDTLKTLKTLFSDTKIAPDSREMPVITLWGGECLNLVREGVIGASAVAVTAAAAYSAIRLIGPQRLFSIIPTLTWWSAEQCRQSGYADLAIVALNCVFNSRELGVWGAIRQHGRNACLMTGVAASLLVSAKAIESFPIVPCLLALGLFGVAYKMQSHASRVIKVGSRLFTAMGWQQAPTQMIDQPGYESRWQTVGTELIPDTSSKLSLQRLPYLLTDEKLSEIVEKHSGVIEIVIAGPCPYVTEEGWKVLAKLENLTRIKMLINLNDDSPFIFPLQALVPSWPHLEKIEVHLKYSSGPQQTIPSPQHFSFLSQCPDTVEVSVLSDLMFGWGYTLKVEKFIETAPMIIAEACPAMTILKLNAPIKSECLSALARHCKRLEKIHGLDVLDVEEINVTHQGWEALLNSCPNLSHVGFRNPNQHSWNSLRQLFNEGKGQSLVSFVAHKAKGLDDGHMESFGKLPTLQSVQISGSPGISDYGISCLLDSKPHLKISLMDCSNVSVNMLRRILQITPSTRDVRDIRRSVDHVGEAINALCNRHQVWERLLPVALDVFAGPNGSWHRFFTTFWKGLSGLTHEMETVLRLALPGFEEQPTKLNGDTATVFLFSECRRIFQGEPLKDIIAAATNLLQGWSLRTIQDCVNVCLAAIVSYRASEVSSKMRQAVTVSLEASKSRVNSQQIDPLVDSCCQFLQEWLNPARRELAAHLLIKYLSTYGKIEVFVGEPTLVSERVTLNSQSTPEEIAFFGAIREALMPCLNAVMEVMESAELNDKERKQLLLAVFAGVLARWDEFMGAVLQDLR